MKNSIRYLVDNGIVFEINRQILHPLGLAITVDADRNSKKKLILSVIESDDDVGFVYDEETFEFGKAKFEKFKAKQQEITSNRQQKLGFIEQK
jgi:hypothetical protein